MQRPGRTKKTSRLIWKCWKKPKKRDHRKLGREMDLFHFEPEYAPGAVFWHDKGYKIYRKLIEYMRNRQEHNGYIEIATPRIMDRVLWEISGHWDKYGAHNYSGKTEDEKTVLRQADELSGRPAGLQTGH